MRVLQVKYSPSTETLNAILAELYKMNVAGNPLPLLRELDKPEYEMLDPAFIEIVLYDDIEWNYTSRHYAPDVQNFLDDGGHIEWVRKYAKFVLRCIRPKELSDELSFWDWCFSLLCPPPKK